MLNKLLPKTPLGIALTAAAVLLTVSPEARKVTRKIAVKGVSTVLDLADGLKNATAGARAQLSGIVSEAKMTGGMSLSKNAEEPAINFDTEIEPEPFLGSDSNPIPFNVLNDSALKKQMLDSNKNLH